MKIFFKKYNIARLRLAFTAWGIVALCFIYLKELELIESNYRLFFLYSLFYWIIQIINLFIREKNEKSKISLTLVHLSGLSLFFILMNYRWLFIPVLVYMFPLYITMEKKEYIKITIYSYTTLIIFAFIDYIFITHKYIKNDLLVLLISGLMSLVFRQSNKVYSYQKEIIEKSNRELRIRENITKEELLLAKNIQKAIIPVEKIENKKIKIVSIYKPIEELGGDFFDVIETERGFLVFISDVSGHGIPAAIITVMIKAYIDSTPTYKKEDPKKLLEEINKKLIDKTNNNFVTVFAGFYNKYLNTLTYAKAAHNSPVMIRENNLISLDSRGKFLGVFENIEIEEKKIQLQKNDKIIIFTDGLIEIVKEDGEEFEDDFFSILKNNSNLDIDAILDIIKYKCEELKQYMHDDICIVGVQIK
ncbi:MAG TPA: SpoIIE family protein phosphatase [Spirochaetota bacterium]|nr:SpoIIE family protein phosphatase [Spirochaetota bacterium]HPQ48389.1 SpoIIE family protein phosphatase [Spirochaetota bacterium]